MSKRFIVVFALLLLVATGSIFAGGAAAYPERDITTVVVWGAGGGTDVLNRLIMAEMAKELGVNVNVVNVTGGVSGSAGMNEAFNRPHDGYTLAGLSESNVTAAVMGGFNQRVNVWDWFIVGGSPDLISVRPDSPFQTIQDLVNFAKANPGAVKAGAAGAGSIHHLNLLAFENGTGTDFNFIPYDGSAPSQNAALSGEVEIIITSVAEQAQLIRGGELRPLAMLIPNSFTVESTTVPSAFDAYPGLSDFLPLGQSIGFGMVADSPAEAKTAITEAFKKAMTSVPVVEYGQKNFYVMSGLYGDAANNLMATLESNFAWTLADLGSAKVSPQGLGIPRP